jgi:hypothetical protein
MPNNDALLCKELADTAVELLSSIRNHLEDLFVRSDLNDIKLIATLNAKINLLSRTSGRNQILFLTEPDRIEPYVDQYDVTLMVIDDDNPDWSEEEIYGTRDFREHLVELGEHLDYMRTLVLDLPPDESHYRQFRSTDTVLASIQRNALRYGFTVVMGFEKRSLAERLRQRKHHIRWLRTPAGRAYIHKKALRLKRHLRKDPKRVKIGRKVSTVYKHG